MKPFGGGRAPWPTGGSFLWPSVQLLHFSGDAKDQVPGQGLHRASALTIAHYLSAFGRAMLFPPQSLEMQPWKTRQPSIYLCTQVECSLFQAECWGYREDQDTVHTHKLK